MVSGVIPRFYIFVVMYPQLKTYYPSFPAYFSLSELTDLYFDNFAISFVSFSPKEKKDFFGKNVNEKMVEKLEGKILIKAWKELPYTYSNCMLGDFELRADGFSGIIMIDNRLSQENNRKYIPKILTGFKNRSTLLLNQFHGTHGRVFWGNNYKERVIENIEELKDCLASMNIKAK